jgi:hypothetical protein
MRLDAHEVEWLGAFGLSYCADDAGATKDGGLGRFNVDRSDE